MKQPSLWHSCAATANLDLSPRPDIHTACFYPLSSGAGPYLDTPDATPPRATHETWSAHLCFATSHLSLEITFHPASFAPGRSWHP